MTDPRDPYTVLGLSPGATPRAIRTAYRALARRHHPDRTDDPASIARMIEVNVAWEALRSVVRGERPDTPPSSATAADAARTTADRRHVRRGKDGREVAWRRGVDGEGAAGPPPGRPSGTILEFGRYLAWSLGEVARHDPGYLLWLEAREEAAPFVAELRDWLVDLGFHRAPVATARR